MSNYTQQISNFIDSAKPALRNITSINVVVLPSLGEEVVWAEQTDGSRGDVAAILRPLARLCIGVKHLRLEGDVGAPLLAVFVDSCRRLSSLDTVRVPASTMGLWCSAVPSVMHNITSLRLKPFLDEFDGTDFDGTVGLFRAAIASCSRILHTLDVGNKFHVGPGVWAALHGSRIEVLRIRTPHHWEDGRQVQGPPAGVSLPHLREIALLGDEMHLSPLTALLRAAPQIHAIKLSCVWLYCDRAMVPELEYLNSRLRGGLSLAMFPSAEREGRSREEAQAGLVLHLEPAGYGTGESGMPLPSFVGSLSPLECFTRVSLKEPTAPLLRLLRRAFPRAEDSGFTTCIDE